jgi:hypothetical protein
MMEKGIKYDHDKPKLDLLPPHALEAVARVLTYGAKKYSPDNWKLVSNPISRYRNAAFRHFNEVRKGNIIDDETGEHHLAHAICCFLFELEMYETNYTPISDETKEDNPNEFF